MPKITLTPELSEKLKMERLNSKITATELANKLKISVGKLSNIENCKVKEMDLGLFNDMIDSLIPKEKRKEYIENLLNDTSIRFSKKDIEEQDWFTIFDLQVRKVSINDELVKWLKTTCEEISLQPKDIMAIVNENNIDSDNPVFIEEFKKCEPNQLFFEHFPDRPSAPYIKFDLPLDFLDDIINRKITDISYVFMLGIVNAFVQIPKCKYYGTEASKILHNLKFYTLIEKRKILSQESLIEPFSIIGDSLPTKEKEYLNHKRQLLKHLDKFNDWNASKTNIRLETLNNNFSCDPSFTLAFCTLPLDKLKELDRDTKMNFLKEIKERIETLAKNAKVEEKLEDYDI